MSPLIPTDRVTDTEIESQTPLVPILGNRIYLNLSRAGIKKQFETVTVFSKLYLLCDYTRYQLNG